MRILPIANNLFMRRVDYNKNKRPLTNRFAQYPNDTFSLNFGHRYPITSKKDFRWHIAHHDGHTCLYCDDPLTFESIDLFAWIDEGLFSEPIIKITKQLEQHKCSLKNIPKTIFSMLEERAIRKPNERLENAINSMAVAANRDLYKIQEPIFNAIIEQAKMLPANERDAILYIIEISKKRIFRQPYKEEYSALELQYQIERLTESISNENQAEKINNITALLMLNSIRKDKQIVTKGSIERVLKTLNPDQKIVVTPEMRTELTRKKLIFMIIDAIKQEANVAQNEDIERLCDNAVRQLNDELIVRKFTNKGFMYDLAGVLDKDILDPANLPIRSKIFKIANGLPTSKNSVQAFIAKHDDSTPKKFAYDLFARSITTVEHGHPTSKDGPDVVGNYFGACADCNSARQNGSMYKKLRHHHNTHEEVQQAVQRHADQIIRDANNRCYTYPDAQMMLEILEQQSTIKIDTSALKDRTPGHG